MPFDFIDGNRPNPQFSRNVLSAPIDITGSRLQMSNYHYCEKRFAVTGTVHVCGKSPSSALSLLKEFRSTRDGQSIVQHMISTYPSILFPANSDDGFLDESLLEPTWSGANWTYFAEFMDKREARMFVEYLQTELVPELIKTDGLLCTSATESGELQALQMSAGHQGPSFLLTSQLPNSLAAQTKHTGIDALTYDVKVKLHMCGANSEVAANAADDLLQHIWQTYPSVVYPRTVAQLLTDMERTERMTICETKDLCCCREPLQLEFVVSFRAAKDAETFDKYLVLKDGEAFHPASAGCDFCVDVHDVREYLLAYLCQWFLPVLTTLFAPLPCRLVQQGA